MVNFLRLRRLFVSLLTAMRILASETMICRVFFTAKRIAHLQGSRASSLSCGLSVFCPLNGIDCVVLYYEVPPLNRNHHGNLPKEKAITAELDFLGFRPFEVGGVAVLLLPLFSSSSSFHLRLPLEIPYGAYRYTYNSTSYKSM